MKQKAAVYTLPELKRIQPMTEAQEKMFHYWDKKYNLILDGAAGSGKTMVALYLALNEILNHDAKKQIVIVRSPVATADLGALPGTLAEKESAYIIPYIGLVNELFGSSKAYEHLVERQIIRFMTTAYIRGISLHDCYVIVDEMQNCNFHQLDSVITRAGRNTRYIFCGDYNQSDLVYDNDRKGILEFLQIAEHLKFFKRINFKWSDCVRSGIARDYLMVKEMHYQARINESRIASGIALVPVILEQNETEIQAEDAEKA